MTSKRLLTGLVATVTTITSLGFLGQSQAARTAWQPPAPPRERSVPGVTMAERPAGVDAPTAHSWTPPATVWPAPGSAVVRLSASAPARPAGLPVSVGRPSGGDRSPDSVRVDVLDRPATAAAAVDGVLVRVTDNASTVDGAVSLGVDYRGFRYAMGGDWASRFRLAVLPACAVSTPDRQECQVQTPLPSRNDAATGEVVADVPVHPDGTVVALAAAATGGGGDYKASSLSPSASWQVSTQSGDFSWTYPMPAPPVPGGLDPDLALSYSSGRIDGRIATTNNQTSWIGEGFEMSPGFVERRYKPCADDGVAAKPGDQCWGGDFVSVMLGSHSSDLIKDDSGTWRLREDDGTRVEHLTGAANGALGGEYWKLTTTDGTQYFFGRNRLPGWDSTKPQTNSTWTVPVFGNNAGEPCNAATFAASWCQQAWRWNLDHVVDVHGNAIVHYYAAETNYYGRNLTASAATVYTRGGYLLRTEYGLRAGSEYSTPAIAQVVYGVDERCLPSSTFDCAPGKLTAANASHWPDVPFDRICDQGATCTNRYSPTFFTRKRLTKVTTQIRGGSGYSNVDSWTLEHTYPASGDGLGPALWLNRITHAGLVGGSTSLPAVTLTGTQLENRVDALEGLAPMIKWRLSGIRSETGGSLSVTYSNKECVRGSVMPAAPESNTLRCFPQYWTPEGSTDPIQDWFHKYVVAQLVAIDNTGFAPFDVTTYQYLGGTAWHYDEEYLLPANRRTWSQWRGYQRVRIVHGDPSEQQSMTEHLFFRGMDGDTLPGGSTRHVSLTDSEGNAVNDNWRLNGFQRESTVYNGPAGALVSGEIDDPLLTGPTAVQGTRQAYRLDTEAVRKRVALRSGGLRRTETRTTFDSYGQPDAVSDLGDTSTATDDHCTRYTYARNTDAWLLDPVAREEVVSVACTATPSRPDDLVSDVRSYFDGSGTLGAAPTRGDVTRTEELASWSGGPDYLTTNRSSYDGYGRVTDSYDAINNHTTTTYTPPTGGPVTQTATTNPLGHTVTTTLDPSRAVPVTEVDANGKRTELRYDALGRLTGVWLPGRATTQSPTLQFGYLIPTDASGVVNGPAALSTRRLRNDGGYNTSYELFDSLLRPRQTQRPAPGGGRLITDTFYNTRGQAWKTNNPYLNNAEPSSRLFAAQDNQVPGQTVSVYDGADRKTAEIFRVLGAERWRTTTAYGGDRVDVDPPDGGVATTTLTDANGRTVELRQYHGGSPSGGYDVTRYTYTPAGQVETVTDEAGHVWGRHYDLRGRLVQSDDPDAGTSTKTYDDLDRVVTSTDSRGRTLAYAYDPLGRRTELHDGSLAGPKLASWAYDTVARGQLTSATRWVGTDAYTSAVTGYDDRYQPTGRTVTLPMSEGALAGTYNTTSTYNLDGSVATTTLPAAGGLVAETLTSGYNELGMLTTLTSGLGTYVNVTSYSSLGSISQRRYGNTGSRVVRSYTYEDGTNRLIRDKTDLELATNATQADAAFRYDDAGNVTSVADTPPGGSAVADVQCFQYDYLRRMTEAWTATDNCSGIPSLAVLGGVAPYWQSLTYDATGNRLTETRHAAAGDTLRTYSYSTAQPHALATVVQEGQAGARTDRYGYDAAGDTTSRPGQTLAYDAEGHLASVTQGGSVTSYLYDADGNRLLRRDPNYVTLYLGATELRLARVSGVVTGTRYYDDGTGTSAVRTYDNRLYWLVDDHHGTASLMVDASTLAVTRRRFTPFGEPRGAGAAWKGERGFVDGTIDATTGLTHLGAREYDPALGRFLSVDPVIDSFDPQQMNGYAYANDNPETFSDPDGLILGGAACGPDGYKCGMSPDVDSHGRSRHKSRPQPTTRRTTSGGARRGPWYRQPDGGIDMSDPPTRPRIPWYRQPDGGQDSSSDLRCDVCHLDDEPPPAPPAPPKRHWWQRGWHVFAQFTGIDAARRCITQGSLEGCAEAVVTVASLAIPGSALAVRAGSALARTAAVDAARIGGRMTAERVALAASRAADWIKPPYSITYYSERGGLQTVSFLYDHETIQRMIDVYETVDPALHASEFPHWFGH